MITIDRRLYDIKDIERVFPDWYRKDHELSYSDQKFIWENTPLPKEDDDRVRNATVITETHTAETTNSVKGNVLNGSVSVSGGYKNTINSALNWYESPAISLLKRCNTKSSPKEVARLLTEIFHFWPSKEGHWLWVAQRFTTRAINWQMSATIKQYLRGGIRKTPPAHFTYEIGFRKKAITRLEKENKKKRKRLSLSL